jgi:hypothetical protein
MKIPLGYLMHKMCSTKHEVILRLGQKRTQSSFTANATKGGGRTLIKIPRSRAIEANSNFMHNKLLSPPSKQIPHQPHSLFS